jgi:hypothetical protein
MAKRRRYAVLCEAEVTFELVVTADSPEAAVQKAKVTPLGDWEDIGQRRKLSIDSVTERRKNGRAFSVEDDWRCVEVEDLPW